MNEHNDRLKKAQRELNNAASAAHRAVNWVTGHNNYLEAIVYTLQLEIERTSHEIEKELQR